MSRFTNTGRNHWQSRTGYQYGSKPWARFERPAGEPSWGKGSAITIAVVLVFGFLFAAWSM